MEWKSNAFTSDIVELTFIDILKLLIGYKLRDSACEVVLRKRRNK